MSRDTGQTPEEPRESPQPPEELFAEAKGTFPTDSSPADAEHPHLESLGTAPSAPQAGPFALHQHSYVTEYIKLADQKAAVVLAVSTGLLCYLFKNGLHKLWMKAPLTWGLPDVLCFFGMAGLLVGLCLAAAVVVPWLRKTHRGLVFFRSVTEFESATVYASEVLSSPDPLLTRAILKHTYDLSKVCSSKYAKLGIALWASSVGIALSVLALLLK
jgi:hypothetical protein